MGLGVGIGEAGIYVVYDSVGECWGDVGGGGCGEERNIERLLFEKKSNGMEWNGIVRLDATEDSLLKRLISPEGTLSSPGSTIRT